MQLIAKKPEKAAKRLKLMLFGTAGVGKTTAAIGFPKPYIIDTERGSEQDEYVDRINAVDGAVLQTTSFDLIIEQVKALASQEHEFKTLVVDPITVVYDGIAEAHEKKIGSDFGRHLAAAKKDWKRLTSLLSNLDMNVVFTSHAKTLWSSEKTMTAIGQTFDGPKGADYYMDLVIEVQKKDGVRLGVVHKSRCTGLDEGDEFIWSYEALAEKYGRDVLEKNAEAIEFGSTEDVQEVRRLLDLRHDGAEIENKILKKAGAEDIADLTAEQIGATIQWLTNKAN